MPHGGINGLPGCALCRLGSFGISGKLPLEMAFSSIVSPLEPFGQCSSDLSHAHIIICDDVCNQGGKVSHLDPTILSFRVKFKAFF